MPSCGPIVLLRRVCVCTLFSSVTVVCLADTLFLVIDVPALRPSHLPVFRFLSVRVFQDIAPYSYESMGSIHVAVRKRPLLGEDDATCRAMFVVVWCLVAVVVG